MITNLGNTKISLTLLILINIFHYQLSLKETQSTFLSVQQLNKNDKITIERNNSSVGLYNISVKNPGSFITSTDTNQIEIDNSLSYFKKSYENVNHLFWKISKEYSSVRVTVLSSTCVFPLMFGSSDKIKTELKDDKHLELNVGNSDFKSKYSESAKISEVSYESSEIDAQYIYVNILCPFFKVIFGSNQYEIINSLLPI